MCCDVAGFAPVPASPVPAEPAVAERCVMRAWKIGVLVVAGVLWAMGLADQLESFEMTMRYVALSAVMVAVAALV